MCHKVRINAHLSPAQIPEHQYVILKYITNSYCSNLLDFGSQDKVTQSDINDYQDGTVIHLNSIHRRPAVYETMVLNIVHPELIV